MKRMKTRNPTPEEIIDSPEGPLLKLKLICNQCGATAKHEFEYVMVNPEFGKYKAEEWDRVLLSRIIDCKQCNAVDDYKIAPLSYLKISTELFRGTYEGKHVQRTRPGSRIVVGISQLWDGTVARRPSQLLSHLRKLTERHPKDGRAWRCLGNAQERFGQLQQAEASWRKALEVDPKDLESNYSLASFLAKSDQWTEAFEFLRSGIRLLPKAHGLDPDHRYGLSLALVDILAQIPHVTDEPVALMASWTIGESKKTASVTISSVDIRRVNDWDRLAEFLVVEDLLVVDLTSELPEDTPSILERRLAGDRIESTLPTISPPVVNPNRRVGRNAPCPCGSGKKYKRCCGR